MDQNIQKALWLGVGIMMFIAIVSTGLFLFNKGKNLAEASGEQLDTMSEQLASIQYEKFDNMVVTGGDVLNAIKQYKQNSGSFIIEVNTSYPSSTQYISSGNISSNVISGSLSEKSKAEMDQDLQESKNIDSSMYINPQGSFMTQLIYDANDVVKGIVATQE
mgnify:FL=1